MEGHGLKEAPHEEREREEVEEGVMMRDVPSHSREMDSS